MQQSMREIFSDWIHHYILTLKGPRSSMYTQSSKLYLYGFETFFRALSHVKDIVTLMIKILSIRLHPRPPMLCILTKSSMTLSYSTDLKRVL